MADRFGWTPEEVDGMPAGTADWMLAMAVAVEEVKTERAEKAGG